VCVCVCVCVCAVSWWLQLRTRQVHTRRAVWVLRSRDKRPPLLSVSADRSISLGLGPLDWNVSALFVVHVDGGGVVKDCSRCH
jgi:hypothetical protein